MKKMLISCLFLLGCVVVANADQKMQTYETQIATTAFVGFASARTYIDGPCLLYGIELSNPGALTQDVMLYDNTTLLGEIESDNVENDYINFDVPINISTSFKIKTATATAGSYAMVHYKVGNYLTDAGQKQMLFAHILSSGTAQEMSSTPIIIRKIIVNAISAQTVTLSDGSTTIGKIYSAAATVTQRDLYDTPVYVANLKYASSAAAEDSYIMIQYEPAFANTGWTMLTQVCTDKRAGGTFTAGPVDISNIWVDSQSTAETVTIYDGSTAKIVIYNGDDATVTRKYENYVIFDTSVTIASSQGTTPSYVTVIHKKR